MQRFFLFDLKKDKKTFLKISILKRLMRADFWSRDLYLGCMNACFAWKSKGELLLLCARPAHPDHERQADEKHRQSLVGQGKERNDDPGDPQTCGSGGIAKLRAPRVFCCEYGVPPQIQGDAGNFSLWQGAE